MRPCSLQLLTAMELTSGSFSRLLNMIKERVRAGLARAKEAGTKEAGTKLGRSPLPQAKEDAIRAALSQPGRPGVCKIAAQLGATPPSSASAGRHHDGPSRSTCSVRRLGNVWRIVMSGGEPRRASYGSESITGQSRGQQSPGRPRDQPGQFVAKQ